MLSSFRYAGQVSDISRAIGPRIGGRYVTISIVKLLYTPTSPYARKVRVLAHELRIELNLQATDPHADDDPLLAASPVGKVPVLVLDDGSCVQDSRVICDYLDQHAGRPRPAVAAQAREALAEAILDAAVTVVMERRREPAERSQRVIDRQFARIRRIVGRLNVEALGPAQSDPLTREQIGVAVSLAYLDFRLPDLGWRTDRQPLADWFNSFEARPSMNSTEPPPSA